MDDLAGMRPRWLVRPLVWLANKMSGPLFIVEFVVFLILWMALNTLTPVRFDGWPFMGLNLFMSALAGIQAAVIGVKQTVSDYRRTQAEAAHTAKIDRMIEHIEQLEIDRSKDARNRAAVQARILALLEGGD